VAFARGALKSLAAARMKAVAAWVALGLVAAGAGFTAYPGLVSDRPTGGPAGTTKPALTAVGDSVPSPPRREESDERKALARRLLGMWKPPLPLGNSAPSLIEFKEGGTSEWTSDAAGYRVSYRVTGEDTLELFPAPDCAVEPRQVRFRLVDNTLTLLFPGGVLRLSSVAGGQYQSWELRCPEGMTLHRQGE
jgi:hypothetical protein